MARHDENSQVMYLLLNSHDHSVISHGINFYDFVHALKKPLNNILLINNQYDDSEFHYQTQLSYVPYDQLESFLKINLHKLNGFCWVDFDDILSLDAIEGQEIAELLYLGHMKKHLNLPFFQNLDNRFAYLSESDGWLNKIYYRNWTDFFDILGNVISKKLSDVKLERTLLNFRKKKQYPAIDSSLLHQLNTVLTEGIAFSYHDLQQSRTHIEIPFWVIGDYNDMDEMLEVFRDTAKTAPSGYLCFDKKQKEWTIRFTV